MNGLKIGNPKWDNRQSKIERDSIPQSPADCRIRIPKLRGLIGRGKNQTENRNFDRELRDEAEGKLVQSPGVPGEMQGKTLEKVIHELQMRQIELEMQNEELSQAQLALEESRQRYADLYDFAPVGYFTFTSEALIKEVNLTAATLLGVIHQKLINRRFRWFITPSNLDLWDQHFLSVLKQGEKQTCELMLKRQDGSTFQVGLESIRIEMSRGTFEVHTAVTDVTERKQSEKALQESEERYRLLVENAGEAVFVAQDGRLQFSNTTSLKLTGYTREEMMSRPFIEFIHQDDRELVLDRHIKRQEGLEPPPVYSFRIITQSGDMRWVNLNAVQIEWEGKPATLNFMVDITDLKQAEESLRLSDEKISKAFRASPDWMTISTLEEGRYVDVNDAFVQLSGFSREEALKKTLLNLDLWEDPHERDRAVKIIRKKGRLKNFECKIRIKSGEVRTMLWSAEPFDLKGRKYVTDTNRDITELRKAQENLEQALENLRRALGGTVEALAVTSEARDPYTAGHQRRVANLARTIGQEMGLSEDKMNGLFMAGGIHDLGKISIPAEILSKPGKLSDIEFSLIKNHPKVGYEVLKDVVFPWPIARIVLEHHERMNRSGYPNGLTGDQILIETKILIVADVVEAMISHRPYRPALGVDAALEEIKKNKGILYDPEVVEVCLKLFNEKGFMFE